MEMLDAVRGDRPRSEYIREAVTEKINRKVKSILTKESGTKITQTTLSRYLTYRHPKGVGAVNVRLCFIGQMIDSNK